MPDPPPPPRAVDLEEMRKRLTSEQFRVCFRGGTEPAFTGEYWNTKTTGLYRCVACANALFVSTAKFDSGTGWPSFWDVCKTEAGVALAPDETHGMVRTEVRCGACAAHLGHLFEDGPQPTGLRYCINSAALKLSAA